MTKLLSIFLFEAYLSFFIGFQGPAIVVTPPNFLTPCGQSGIFEVDIINETSNIIAGGTLIYAFGEDIHYVLLSVAGTGVTEANTADPNAPVFALPDIPPFGTLSFTFTAKASCESLYATDVVHDQLTLQYGVDSLTISGAGYNIQKPQVLISAAPLNHTGAPNSIFDREIAITATGFGEVSEIIFTDTYLPGFLKFIGVSAGQELSTIPLVVKLTGEDFATVGDGDNLLEKEEIFILTETFQIIQCGGITSTPVTLEADWGCEFGICGSAPALQGSVSTAISLPNLKVTQAQVQYAGFCDDGFALYQFKNEGTELTPGAATATDIRPEVWINHSTGYNCIGLFKLSIGNTTVQTSLTPQGRFILLLNLLTADPDGPGTGLEDLDGDGQYDDLVAGEMFLLRVEMSLDEACFGACQSFFFAYFYLQPKYSNICDEPVLNTLTYSGFTYTFNFSGSPQILPTAFQPGSDVPVSFYLYNSSGNGFSFSSPGVCQNDLAYLYFILPQGIQISASFAPEINGNPVNFQISGDTITLITSALTFSNLVEFQLQVPCVEAGPPNPDAPCPYPLFPPETYQIEYGIEYFCDVACQDEPLTVLCKETPNFIIVCPHPQENLNGSGPAAVQFTVERIEINPISPGATGLELQRALALQRVLMSVYGQVEGAGTFDETSLLIEHYAPGAQPWLEPLSLVFTLYDAETGAVLTCSDPGEVTFDNFPSGFRRIKYSLAEAFAPGGCFEGYHLTDGDGLLCEAILRVTDYVPQTLTPVYGLNAGFEFGFNGEDYTCASLPGGLSVVKPSMNTISIGATQASTIACDTITVTATLTQNLGGAGAYDLFPYEGNPYALYTHARLLLPPGCVFVAGSGLFRYEHRPGNPPSGTVLTETLALPPPIITPTPEGLQLDFDLSGMPQVDMIKNNTIAQFSYRIIPSCPGNLNMEQEYHFVRNVYIPEYLTEGVRTATNISIANPGTRTFTTPNALAEETADYFTWKLDLCAGPGRDIPQNFMALYPQAGVTITALIEQLPNGGFITWPLEAFDMSGGVFAKIGLLDAASPPVCRHFELRAISTNCQPSSVLAKTNFQCHEYPAHPDSLNGYCQNLPLSLNLQLQPQEASLSIQLSEYPAGEITLCEESIYEIDILNWLKGLAGHIQVTLELPSEGMIPVSGSSELRHGNGAYFPIPDPVQIPGTDTWVWDIDSSGLPIAQIGLAGSDNFPMNEIFLKFSIKTDCDYVPMSQFVVRSSFLNTCGEEGFSSPYISPVLPLKGAPDIQSEYSSILNFPNENAFQYCADQNDLFVSIANHSQISTGEEVIKLTFKNSIGYVPGSFAPLQYLSLSDAPVEYLEGLFRVLEWTIPAGIPKDSSLQFQIGLNNLSPGAFTCGDLEIILEIVQVKGIPCAEAPGGYCDIEFPSELETFVFPATWAFLDWISAQATSIEDAQGGEIFEIAGVINNASGQDTDGALQVSLIYDANGDGVYLASDDTLIGSVELDTLFLGAGQTASLTFSLNVPGALACGGFMLLAQNGCACSQAVIILPEVPLDNAGTPDTVCFGEPLVLFSPPNPGYSYYCQGGNIDDPGDPNPEYLLNVINPGEALTESLIRVTTRPDGCQSFDTVTVTTIRPGVEIVAAPLNNGFEIPCSGGLGGTLTVVPIGITMPQSYLWDDGSTQAMLTGFPAGDYSVTVADAFGCFAFASHVANEPTPLDPEIEVLPAVCPGSTGIVTVELAGGVPPYLVNGALSSGIYILENLSPGSIPLLILDQNACPFDTVIIIEEFSSHFNITSWPASCHGVADGKACVEPLDGYPPYNYIWSNGQTVACLEGLPAGIHFVTVTDGNGCEYMLNATVSEPPLLEAMMSSTDNLCKGQVLGTAKVIANGGIPPYYFLWSTGSAASELLGLPAGEYSVTITDSLGCTRSDSITVGEPSGLEMSFVSQDVVCFGENTGSATVILSGGVAPYTFQWSHGGFSQAEFFLEAATYSVTATDANGCEIAGSVVISQPLQIEPDFSTMSSSCHGDDGEILILYPLPEDGYLFSLDGNHFQMEPVFGDLDSGDYLVIIKDANDCLSHFEIAVPQDFENPLITGIPDTALVIALGESVQFNLAVLPHNATIVWTGAGLSCYDCLSPVASPLEDVVYTISAEIGGCIAEGTILVKVRLEDWKIYIPNLFSPNADGINDDFFIYAGSPVEKVKVFRIFSRWGGKVFEQRDFLPNDPRFGWDGTFLGKPVNVGVYAYFAEIELIDGRVILREGDVSLVR